MNIVMDTEANGLYDKVDTLWCIVLKDLDSDQTLRYPEIPLKEVLSEMTQADKLICHNIIGYDLPVLKKVIDWEPGPTTEIVDTLVMSRLANPDRERPVGYKGKGGVHGLGPWGYRIGRGKPDHDEWDKYSPEMLHRCTEDTEINKVIHGIILEELEGFSEESISLEHEVAEIMAKQERRGIRIDVPKAEECVQDLTSRIEQIDKEVVPLLPKSLKQIGTAVMKPFLKTGKYRKQTREYFESFYGDLYEE